MARPPKPDEALSDWSKKYRRDPDAAVPTYEIPLPPHWLSEDDRVAYVELADRIQSSICCITKSDWLALASFARWLGIFQDAGTEVDTHGITEETQLGGRRKSGSLLALETATRMINEYCTRFGLNPSARSGVKSIGHAADETEAFLKDAEKDDSIEFPKAANQ